MVLVPRHWEDSSWEEKAQENRLFAIQTTDQMSGAPASGFPPELIKSLMERGRVIYREHLAPLLAGGEVVFEYGCGAGRILNALVEAGHPVFGVDISPTMIRHCRTLVPAAKVCKLKASRDEIPDGAADFAFSYAVLQHIARLSAYLDALSEVARVVRPGGRVALHLNCVDLVHGGRTLNYKDRSIHYRPGEKRPVVHRQSEVSGVRIGWDRLKSELAERGIEVETWRPHNPDKPKAVWVMGRKRPT